MRTSGRPDEAPQNGSSLHVEWKNGNRGCNRGVVHVAGRHHPASTRSAEGHQDGSLDEAVMRRSSSTNRRLGNKETDPLGHHC
jgi:hypothetical protein